MGTKSNKTEIFEESKNVYEFYFSHKREEK